MEIPLKTECAKYFQFFPFEYDNALESGGIIKESFSLPFKEQLFVSDDKTGFMVFFESEENFCPFGNDKAFELVRGESCTIMRIRLFDEEPPRWRAHNRETGMMMFPISFRFGMMATPIKPFPENVFAEKAVHIDCYKKIVADYKDFLSSPFEDTGEITFDRLKRLGVNTLYLHEKWNDLQNSPLLTSRTSRRLRYIVDEAHKRGIKVVPYFGYEISTLAPYFAKMREEVTVCDTYENNGWHWYRQPPQRDLKVCQASAWSDFFTDGVEKLLDEYGFDGVYLDGTAFVNPCMNEKHGCGFRTSDGELHVTYPVWGTRKTLKKLYGIIAPREGIINCHAGSAFNLPALSFCTSLWDGEAFQAKFLHGELNKLPDEYFRALYTGRNTGIPIYMLCYLNPPVRDFNMALSTSLPFGVFPKTNDVGEPLEIMSQIWKIYDEFKVEKAEWLPYYSEKRIGITVTNPDVKVSIYRRNDRLLAVFASICSDFDARFGAECEFKNVINAMTGETLSNDGKFTLHLKGFDFAIVEATEN